MIINCTKKLQDEIKIKPDLAEVTNPLFSWHANIIKVNRKKTVVLVNDASRYVIILYALKAKEFKDISTVMIDAIYKTFIHDGINPEIISDYINQSGEVIFSKTQNRTLVARMNKGCEAANIYSDLYEQGSIAQPIASKKVNRFIFVDCTEGNKYPDEIFYDELQKKYSAPAIRCKAVKLKVRLELENFDICRSVMVPSSYTFGELHRIIQKLFDWKNYHLHNFMIFDGNTPIINIVGSKEDFEYQMDTPMVMENDIKICDYIPKYKRVKYRYDYGDNWEHLIEVEDFIFDYDKNYACCLGGRGDSPPEDVGGEGGYEEFVEIMSDPTHEKYQRVKHWAENNWYKGFDIDMVNRGLKYFH